MDSRCGCRVLNIFGNASFENVDIGGLHTRIVGGSNNVMSSILEYFDIGGGGVNALIIGWWMVLSEDFRIF